ncbi:MAG: hypothetical protein OHK0046_33170 [Anaerolineae bacterium]
MRRTYCVLVMLLLLLTSGLIAQEAPQNTLQVIDSNPLSGEEIALDAPLRVLFDRALDCSTVAAAVTLTPDVAGTATCTEEGTGLVFEPSAPYAAGSVYTLTVDTSLLAADGTALAEPFTLDVNTRGALQVLEVLPEPDTAGIAPDAALTVIFSRPVVPLVTVEDMAALPQPLTISPAVEGEGEWLNTAIYTFTPARAWAPGTTYTVTVGAGLQAADGAMLDSAFSWQFTTQTGQVTERMPTGDGVVLDPRIQMRFNVPVDQASLEANFFLRPASESSGTVPGTFEWADDSAGFMFTPSELLQLNTGYTYGFPEGAVLDVTGQSALEPSTGSFGTVPAPAIISTDPSDGETNVQPYGGITLFFASPMDADSFEDRITIDPEPWREPELYYQDYNNSVTIGFPTEPSTMYTITIEPGLQDVYGNAIQTSFTLSFTTEAYPAEVNLEVPGPVGFYNAARDATQVFVKHRNVSRLDLSLYTIPLDRFAQVTMGDNYYDPLFNFAPDPANQIAAWQLESVAPQNALRYDLLSLGEGGTGVVECAGAPASRVKVGDSAIVITEPDPLRARSAPPDGDIVDLLYRDYVFSVVGGPVCANDLLWWEIELRNGSRAWVAEGTPEEYFFDLRTPGQNTQVTLPSEVTDGEGLVPGVYFLQVTSPETTSAGWNPLRHMLVVGTANLMVKASLDTVTVWATDVETGEPIPNAPISMYDPGFNPVGQGRTDENGVVTINVPPVQDLYQQRLAVLDDGTHFGLNLSNWSDGIEPWQFGFSTNYAPARYRVYGYTDRPVYRPDQPVYFRGIVRQQDDVTYTPPEFNQAFVKIYDEQNEIIFDQTVTLTDFGTFSGAFDLAEDAGLGFYRMEVRLPLPEEQANRTAGYVYFSVAEYRLPEFEVTLTAAEPEVVQGETINITVNSRYFFGGLVSDAAVEYNVISNTYVFEGPRGYSYTDFNYDGDPGEFFGFTGGAIASGQGRTDANGNFVIELPADLEDATQSQTFTIEATVRDESDQVVAGRTDVVVHQGLLYVGVQPEEYVGFANEDTTVNLIAVDWDSNPIANQNLEVSVVERRWSSVQEEDPDGRTIWTWEVEEVPVTDGDVTTNADGEAIFTFNPPVGGIYKITASTRDDAGNTVVASTTLWVSSREYVAWRQQNSNRIDLVTDADQYVIGDTAEILITSPFQGETEALVTVERGDVLLVERITLESNSYVYELPITPEYAPNVFVSVFLVKGVDENNPVASFRMGLAQLEVETERKELLITITPDREQAGPRETVTYTVITTDYAGSPVSAELGIALTDLASLSIGDPNSVPLMDFFYGIQGISVRTSSLLTINTDQLTQTVLDTIKGGGGGFGEGGIFDIREDFVDTAYWNGSVVTGDDGTATFEVTLPDNLTTWRMDARGITSGRDGLTLVGQETFDLLSTKPLLIRPVTPRFFVVGDEVVLAAVVNNNTDSAQTVDVALEGTGVEFQGDAVQAVEIAAGGRARVVWPVTVQAVENVDLTFFVRNADASFTDASKPPLGQGEARLLPVYRYEAPEIVGTGGILREAGSLTELVALPQRFDITQGELTVNLERSLGATAIEGLDYLYTYRNSGIEAVVSNFLPNIATYLAFERLEVENQELLKRLNQKLAFALQRLNAEQKPDGGWGWYVQDNSDPLVTAYALIGLAEARDAGFAVDNGIIERAQNYLRGQFIAPGIDVPQWRLDRQAFLLYALARSGAPDVARTTALYDLRESLSLYAQALLARTFHLIGGSDDRVSTLISNIAGEAIVSANGTHWEEANRDARNWNTNTRTTAIILGTLVQVRPDSGQIPNIVRWLMVARTADAWETTQETAWAVMALVDWMRVSRELNADYLYEVAVNDEALASGSVTPQNVTETQTLIVEVADLLAERANEVTITRTEGVGNLYYTAYLRAFLPVPEIEPLNRGIIVQRRYTLLDDPEKATITEARIGEVVQVRLTIIAPNDLHYVVIEDPLPAGTQAINPGLTTEQQIGTRPGLDSDDPLLRGWGWWWFSNIDFRDEQVVLNATYLPAGTYEYVYTIRPGLEGVYNVIPPTGREFFFPEVFGRGAGTTFTVLPAES